MKPFQSSEFISNEETPVVGRSGIPIHIITINGRGVQPVVGYAGESSEPQCWCMSGAYSKRETPDGWDLFFAPKVEVVHVFQHKESGILVPMIEDAEAWIKDADYVYLGTITGPIVPPEKSEVVK